MTRKVSVRNSHSHDIFKTCISDFARLALCIAAISNVALGQNFLNDDLVFATNFGLFERSGGQTFPITAAPSSGLYPSLSRDGRFLTYSRPDPVAGNGTSPSSDLVVLDRTSGQQRVIVNNNTAALGADFDPLSSQVSPSGQFVAYGERLGPAFGTELDATTELKIADFNTGLVVSQPFANRIGQLGPTSDALSAEFRGISFFPNSDSFVTPVLDLIFAPGSSVPDPATSIVRFDRNNNGQWFPAASLSTPTAVATSQIAGVPVDAATTYQIYPAISPSGAGLAYFDVFKPTRGTLGPPNPSDPLSSLSTSRVIRANSDGSNARVLTTFNRGYLPTGLTWTADGSALVVSLSEQETSFGVLDLPNLGKSEIYTVSTSDGTFSFASQLPNGFAPTLPLVSEPFNVSGDFNEDGRLDTRDLSSVNGLFSVGDLAAGVNVTANSRFDLTRDGRVNGADLNQWLSTAGSSAGFGGPFLPGDADLNGQVAFADFLALSANFGSGREWSQGNFDGSTDGTQFNDFLALSRNFGQTAATVAVPEPSTFALTMCSIFFLSLRRRRIQ